MQIKENIIEKQSFSIIKNKIKEIDNNPDKKLNCKDEL